MLGRGGRGRVSWRPSTGTRCRSCLWQAPLPDAQTRPSRCRRSSSAAARRSSFPPTCPAPASSSASAGRRGRIRRPRLPVESWRGDQDLLAHTAERRSRCRSGSLQVRKYCGLAGEFTPLATLAGRGAAAGAGHDQPRGGLLLRDHAGRRRFVAGDQRRRLLRPGPARTGRAERRSWGTRASSRPAMPPADDPTAWKRVAGAEEALSTDYPFHRGIYQAGDGCWPSTAPPAKRRRRCWPTAAWPSFQGPRLRPGGRPGRQHRLLDPGDLAAVPGRHDGGDGGRGRPLPAQGGASAVELRHECFPIAHVSGDAVVGRRCRSWSCWSRPASASSPGGGAVIGRRWGCSSSCGWRWSASVAVLLNQPEWIEEFRPEEKPAIAVLWDASTSMETRDVVRADQPSAAADHPARGDRAAGRPGVVEQAAGADERRDPAVLPSRGRATAPT